jgi:endonuclease/exonuclease/phosphatase family metal-dependent hydrolase
MIEKAHLRILSYNIHKGFTGHSKRFVLNKIKKAIELVHADLVFLQEVLGHHDVHSKKVKDWPTTTQFEYLAESVWPHYRYGKNAIYTTGHHGNAILSRYPFTFFENIDISASPLEGRGLLHGVIEVPHIKTPVHVICIHLALLEVWRQGQIDRLVERIDSHVPHDAPLIVAGDFNDWRERATTELSKRLQLREAFWVLYGQHARTFPSWFPVLKLDRIYYRRMKVVDAQCLRSDPWNELSDHAALYADLNC